MRKNIQSEAMAKKAINSSSNGGFRRIKGYGPLGDPQIILFELGSETAKRDHGFFERN